MEGIAPHRASGVRYRLLLPGMASDEIQVHSTDSSNSALADAATQQATELARAMIFTAAFRCAVFAERRKLRVCTRLQN